MYRKLLSKGLIDIETHIPELQSGFAAKRISFYPCNLWKKVWIKIYVYSKAKEINPGVQSLADFLGSFFILVLLLILVCAAVCQLLKEILYKKYFDDDKIIWWFWNFACKFLSVYLMFRFTIFVSNLNAWPFLIF